MLAKTRSKLTHKALPVFCFTLSLWLAALVIDGVILPKIKSIVINRKKIEDYERLMHDEYGKKILIEQMQKDNHILARRIRRLNWKFAPAYDLSQALQMVYDLAWQNKKEVVTFNRTEFLSENIEKGLGEHQVLIELTTTFPVLVEFVSQLERMPQIISVERIALTLNKESKLQVKMLLTFIINMKGPQGE